MVSLLFLLVGGLNPGGYNGIHWLNIVNIASSPKQFFNCLIPAEFDLRKDSGLYSLPIFVARILGRSAPSFLLKLPLVAVLVMSLSPLVLDQRGQRLRAAIVTVSLCILSHFLCYYAVLEYHYTTLLPVLPVLLWLWQRESVTWFRGLLMTSFVVSLLVFVPTPCFLAPNDPVRFQTMNLLQRVVPVVVAFLCLAVYGLAFTWLARRRPRLITAQMTDRIWPTLRLGGVLGVLLGSVLAAAYLTVPSRLLSTSSKWKRQDFLAHFEETVAQLQRTVQTRPDHAEARHSLAFALVCLSRIDEAIAQYRKALEINPNFANAHHNFGLALQLCGRIDEAIVQFQQALAIEPGNGTTRYHFGDALASRGRFDEALTQFQQALNIEADDAMLLNSLAWLRATCPKTSLRNGVEAIEYAQRANQLCGGRNRKCWIRWPPHTPRRGGFRRPWPPPATL